MAQDASAGFQPPEDAPRAADDSARLVHTEHAAEVLRVLVKDQLELSPDARASARQRGLCVGLLGGLGQGKTEAVYAARRWLLHNSAVSTFIWFRRRPNIVFFDIANHNSEALEFRFAQLQAALNPWNWLLKLMAKSFLLAILLLGLVTATIWAVLSFSTGPAALVFTGHDLGKFPDWGLLGTALRMLLFPWLGWVGFKAVSATALQRREMALFWTVGQAGPQASWMKRNLSAWISSLRRIDVLIVDNLDRASIAQQRAILRSLYKARGGLPYCVVVAFDEQALLHASPDPEAPEALLHKALQVQVRLAPRHPVEAVPLAYLAAESLPLPEWKQAFEHHEVIAVFARVLAQMPSLSPRLAKRFVADVGVGLRVIEKNLLEPESTHATPDFVSSPMSLVMQHAPALFRLPRQGRQVPGQTLRQLIGVAPKSRAQLLQASQAK